MGSIWYCVYCGYETTSRGRCHRCHRRLQSSSLPEMKTDDAFPEVVYDISEWGGSQQGWLIAQLNELEILHRFEGNDLVVDESDDDRTSQLLERMDPSEGSGSGGASGSTATQLPPPGWYPSPDGSPTKRYWNGMSWTEPDRLGQLSDVPKLFPLGANTYGLFASADQFRFGWYEPRLGAPVRFIISKTSPLGTAKILDEFALDEGGWAASWERLVDMSLPLAAAVRAKIYSIDTRQAQLEENNAAAAELDRIGTIAFLPECVLLGGHGYSPYLVEGMTFDVYFTRKGLWCTRQGKKYPEICTTYETSRALVFTGPGRIKKGGGFIGGGFGFDAAAEGMIVAAVLNRLTTKSSIHTIIRYQAADLEVFLFTSVATPDDLRIQLSEPVALINSAAAAASMPTAPTAQSVDLTTQLLRLSEMFTAGLLSIDEFATAKARLLA
jgi:hypothetical protein